MGAGNRGMAYPRRLSIPLCLHSGHMDSRLRGDRLRGSDGKGACCVMPVKFVPEAPGTIT